MSNRKNDYFFWNSNPSFEILTEKKNFKLSSSNNSIIIIQCAKLFLTLASIVQLPKFQVRIPSHAWLQKLRAFCYKTIDEKTAKNVSHLKVIYVQNQKKKISKIFFSKKKKISSSNSIDFRGQFIQFFRVNIILHQI